MKNPSTYLDMAKKLDTVSKSFCLAKWLQVTIDLQNGHTRSCHHPDSHKVPLTELGEDLSALHNTSFKKQQRNMMLNGDRPKECSYCWNIEKLSGNNISDRAIKSADTWAAKHFDRVKKMPWDQSINPTYLEVSFSNKCNFRCLYCSPDISSSWEHEIKTHGPYQLEHPYNSLEMLKLEGKTPIEESENPYVDAFWIWLPEIYPGLENLRITGGEPLLSESTYRVLGYIGEHPNQNLNLSINSNLGVSQDKLTKLIASVNAGKKNIKEFTFYTSLDTWGPAAEYIRTGLNCEIFEKNLKKLISEIPEMHITIMCTFNALSLHSFDEFLVKILEWKKFSAKNGGRLTLDVSYLKDPAFLGLMILPKAWLSKFQTILNSMKKSTHLGDVGFSDFEITKFERLTKYFGESTLNSQDRIRSNFASFIEISDQRKKTSFETTFPEYRSFFKECRAIRSGYRNEIAKREKMKKLRLLLWKISRSLPEALIEAPYRFSFSLLSFYFKTTVPNCKIGYRNSLRYACIEPFFSDLDITIICDEQHRTKVLNRYEIAKKLNPLLGELNFYSHSGLKAAEANCNPFERDRDPLLNLDGSVARVSGSKAEKFVFAFRMLDGDWNTLRDRPSTRQKKWNCHFTALGYPLMKYYDHDSVLKFLLGEINAQDEMARVIRFRNRLSVDKEITQFDDLNHPVIQTLFFNHLCYLKPSPHLLPEHKEIIAAQACWEFWAMEVIRGTRDDKPIQHQLGIVTTFLQSL